MKPGAEERWEVTLRAITAVHEKPAGRGTIPCPVCTTGTVTYERWSSPGRARGAEGSRGKCSTEGCVAWIT